jgi:hypothetical protein
MTVRAPVVDFLESLSKWAGTIHTSWLIVHQNLPSQFQVYLILTLSLLYNASLRQKLCLFTCLLRHSPSDVKGKLDTPSKVISKEAIEW